VPTVSGGIRSRLVQTTLEWEKRYGVAPAVTSAISERDAARLVGMTDAQYSAAMRGVTAVRRGVDFDFHGERYQVKGNRPSGKRGSPVTLVSKPKNYDWDYLVWILYDRQFRIQEAWKWPVTKFKKELGHRTRLSPELLRKGTRIFPTRRSKR